MRRLLVRLVLLLVGAGSAPALGGCGKAPAPPPAPVVWLHDLGGLAEAERIAAREHKPAVVFFGASWDQAAVELERVTFQDARVAALLREGFVTLRVDASDDDAPDFRELADRFKVIGDPNVIVLAPDLRTELARFDAFVSPDVLAPRLRLARERAAHAERVVVAP